ncbi:MAG TPA: hypothetical protein VN748_21335 [Pseudonocardiaceae bacterium]|jgi:hypothetical protein|nr:hypothetical protein [Pseudonocardiaceae bacterium]
MAEDRTQAPSAEELKDRFEELGDKSNLGAGENEADPVTAENPPQDIKAGDQKRVQT